MKQKAPQIKIKRKLLGRIEKRNGQYVFVTAEPKPQVKIEYIPYWSQMA